MLLILVRHADAGERDADKWPDDDLRPLTARGRRRQADCAKAMKKLGITADHLFTSPLTRAVQTAEILAEVHEMQPAVVNEVLGHECSAHAVSKMLDRLGAGESAMLVGHEPSFSRVAAAMIGKSSDADMVLKKSGVIGIEFDGAPAPGAGRLLYLLKPGFLAKF